MNKQEVEALCNELVNSRVEAAFKLFLIEKPESTVYESRILYPDGV